VAASPPTEPSGPTPSGTGTPPGGVRKWIGQSWTKLGVRPSGEARGWLSISRVFIRAGLIAIPIGLVAGLGAVAFYFLWFQATGFFLGTLVGITYPQAGAPAGGIVIWNSSFPRILLLPAVMGLGGLATGLIAQRLAREVGGDGTDGTIHAFHRQDGRIRFRVPILRIIAASLTLGTGGAGGREGPSSQIGGGFGSWWGTVLNLSTKERRIALATGLGAGVGAIFRAPLGGAIYAAEIFYTQDFEPEVFFPAIVASVISYSVYGSFYGFATLFALPSGGIDWNIPQIPLYGLLGLVCAGVGVLFVRMFQRTRRWFELQPWPIALRVTFGMFVASLLVLAVYFALPWGNHFASLASLNVGYGFVQAAMLGQIGLSTLVPLSITAILVTIVLRMTTTSLTVGSGGAAGLFGTSVVLGGLIGTAIGAIFHSVAPSVVSVPEISAFAVVGMMTFFGGISKAPLAVLVMVVEMTGSYSLLVPAMLSIFVAYIATGPSQIFSEQERTRLDSPAHREEYAEYLLKNRPSE
jgi:chloride channel protein, CIC family